MIMKDDENKTTTPESSPTKSKFPGTPNGVGALIKSFETLDGTGKRSPSPGAHKRRPKNLNKAPKKHTSLPVSATSLPIETSSDHMLKSPIPSTEWTSFPSLTAASPTSPFRRAKPHSNHEITSGMDLSPDSPFPTTPIGTVSEEFEPSSPCSKGESSEWESFPSLPLFQKVPKKKPPKRNKSDPVIKRNRFVGMEMDDFIPEPSTSAHQRSIDIESPLKPPRLSGMYVKTTPLDISNGSGRDISSDWASGLEFGAPKMIIRDDESGTSNTDPSSVSNQENLIQTIPLESSSSRKSPRRRRSKTPTRMVPKIKESSFHTRSTHKKTPRRTVSGEGNEITALLGDNQAEDGTKSPRRRRSRTPDKRLGTARRARSKSPGALHSKTADWKRSKSPGKFRSKSAEKSIPSAVTKSRDSSPKTRRRSKSPGKFRSKSAEKAIPSAVAKNRESSPKTRRRSKSPGKFRSKSAEKAIPSSVAKSESSPKTRKRSKSPGKFRSKISENWQDPTASTRSERSIDKRSGRSERSSDRTSGRSGERSLDKSSGRSGVRSTDKLSGASPGRKRSKTPDKLTSSPRKTSQTKKMETVANSEATLVTKRSKTPDKLLTSPRKAGKKRSKTPDLIPSSPRKSTLVPAKDPDAPKTPMQRVKRFGRGIVQTLSGSSHHSHDKSIDKSSIESAESNEEEKKERRGLRKTRSLPQIQYPPRNGRVRIKERLFLQGKNAQWGGEKAKLKRRKDRESRKSGRKNNGTETDESFRSDDISRSEEFLPTPNSSDKQ